MHASTHPPIHPSVHPWHRPPEMVKLITDTQQRWLSYDTWLRSLWWSAPRHLGRLTSAKDAGNNAIESIQVSTPKCSSVSHGGCNDFFLSPRLLRGGCSRPSLLKAMLSNVMSCYVLCHVMPCRVMSCYVMLCYGCNTKMSSLQKARAIVGVCKHSISASLRGSGTSSA